MNKFKLLYFVIFVINLFSIDAQISDKRFCVDEECKVPISYAKTLLKYSSPDSRILSFAPNVDVTIYSKSAGSREDLWGVEINGKRGYVPKHMIRETKILQKPTKLVDTEFSNATDTLQVPSTVEPDKVQEPYEVVDGTTIFLTPQEQINPSSTESPIQPTVLLTETSKLEQPDAAGQIQSSDSQTSTVEDSSKVTESVEDTEKVTENVQDTETVAEAENVKSVETENELDKIKEETETASDEQETSVEEEILAANTNVRQSELEKTEDKIANPAEFNEEPVLQESLPLVLGSVENANQVLDESPTQQPVTTENLVIEDHTPSAPVATTVEQVVAEVSNTENTGLPNEPPKTENDSTQEINTVIDEPEGFRNSENTVPAAEEVKVPIIAEETTVEIKNHESQEAEEPVPVVNDDELITLDSNVSTEAENDIQNADVASIDETVIQTEKNTDAGDLVNENIEVTTTSSDPEVPLPFEDSIDVTPDPLEAVKPVENLKPTLPPLGLFAPASFPNTKQEIVYEEEKVSETDATSESEENTEHAEINENVDSVVHHEEFVVVNEDSSPENEEITAEVDEEPTPGFFSGLFSFFSSAPEKLDEHVTDSDFSNWEEHHHHEDTKEQFCDAETCGSSEPNEIPIETAAIMDFFSFNSDVFLYLVTTAISVIIFLFGYIAFDKSKREGPLIAKINKLEKDLLVLVKENQILQEKLSSESGYETNDKVSNEAYESLKQDFHQLTLLKTVLEEQVQSLEKELENSTEVGMELNRMLTQILSAENGSDVLKANVEHLQKQLVEQQSTVNSANESLSIANTENQELRVELELSNKKIIELQAELDKLLLNILKIEEEKEAQQDSLEKEIAMYKLKHNEINNLLKTRNEEYNSELIHLRNRLEQAERKAELKAKEHSLLTETVKQLKSVKNSEGVLEKLLDASTTRAELQLLQTENQRFSERLNQEQELKSSYEKQAQAANDEVRILKEKYDEADKSRVEAQTKLEVLSNYFKDREAQWQKEISKHEALWAEREGEASSTTERMKFMQDQLQNYKAQTESLKQEIMSQEIELKSQISVLEKKAHENWVSARHAERKLEEAKQEAAQLRHRLTLRERALQEDKNRLPIEQNGEMPVSPLESPASPTLLYGVRDHLTKSPPIPGLPPFLPPPPGAPFMPPPLHGVPPFMPPPPANFFPDHRPPPLGRMSSPPLNPRYSPSSRGYSPYDRNSSSPSDSEYGTSPPHRRGYSPYREERRDYKRPPPPRTNGRNIKKGGSSGNSNESLEKINRQQSKV